MAWLRQEPWGSPGRATASRTRVRGGWSEEGGSAQGARVHVR